MPLPSSVPPARSVRRAPASPRPGQTGVAPGLLPGSAVPMAARSYRSKSATGEPLPHSSQKLTLGILCTETYLGVPRCAFCPCRPLPRRIAAELIANARFGGPRRARARRRRGTRARRPESGSHARLALPLPLPLPLSLIIFIFVQYLLARLYLQESG